MAQLVERSPSTQNVAGSNPARGSSFFSREKRELSSGVVAWICLVSMTVHVHVNSFKETRQIQAMTPEDNSFFPREKEELPQVGL